ncbi:hypothetical protein LTR37_014294 [Vermiconidia calcicola]|uniref:Uncharacterized protein n=1 Tax=Vermiconidia calcicola TaxID=1690605 RepID=A0ACC3MU05_9PEZI|nr:hypothetical protein LTR37_014294 [Vermiconidia calcicola]
MSTTPITIAVVGFSGRIGVRHTQYVLDNADTDIVALVDPDPTAADVAKKMSPSTPFFTTVGEMLSTLGDEKPQAGIVCVPNNLHVVVAKELVAAGIDILVEKPLCDSIDDGKSLLEDVRKYGVKLLVGHHKRFNHCAMATKKILESRSLGDITAVSALWTGFKPDSYYIVPWRRSKSQGGGVVFNNFVHDIDLLHYFFGPTVRVHAEQSITRRKHEGQDPDDQAEEGLALVLKFASGVVGTFVISDCVASPHNFESAAGDDPGLPQTWYEEGKQEVDVYRIFGTDATLSVPDMTRWSFGDRKKSWESVLTHGKMPVENDGRWPFERRLDHFVRVVRREEEPNCTGEDGLLAVMVCDAVRQALDSESGTVAVPTIQWSSLAYRGRSISPTTQCIAFAPSKEDNVTTDYSPAHTPSMVSCRPSTPFL